jgi:hypothetical protein
MKKVILTILVLIMIAICQCNIVFSQSVKFNFANLNAIDTTIRIIYIGIPNEIRVNGSLASNYNFRVTGANYSIDKNIITLKPSSPGKAIIEVIEISNVDTLAIDSIVYNIKRVANPIASFDFMNHYSSVISKKDLRSARKIKILIDGFEYKVCNDCLLIYKYEIVVKNKTYKASKDKLTPAMLQQLKKVKSGDKVCVVIKNCTGLGGLKNKMNLERFEACYTIK